MLSVSLGWRNAYRGVGILVAAILFVTQVACSSYSKAFASAATPLATQMSDKFAAYVAETDVEAQPVLTALNGEFLNACVSGQRTAAADAWFRNHGFRESYVWFLNNDPLYDSPDGQAVFTIQMNNVTTFDYIVSLGTRE